MNEILAKELECAYAEAEFELSKIMLSEAAFTESPLFDKVSDTVEAIMEQLEAFFRAIKEKIAQIFSRFTEKDDTYNHRDGNFKAAFNQCIGAYHSYCSHLLISVNSFIRNHDNIGLAQSSEIVFRTACKREIAKAVSMSKKLKTTQRLLLANDIVDALNKESKAFMNKVRPHINRMSTNDPDRTRLYMLTKKVASFAMEIGNEFSSMSVPE